MSVCDSICRGFRAFVVVDNGCVGFVLWLSFSTMTREVSSRDEFPGAWRRAPSWAPSHLRDSGQLVISPTLIGDSWHAGDSQLS